MKVQRIFFAAAGSGGHILPALVLAQQWLNKNPTGDVWFFTSSRSLDQKLVQQSSVVHRSIFFNLETFSLKTWWKIPIVFFQVLHNMLTIFWYILRWRPEKIVCTGGLIGIPLCVIGRLMGVLVEVYELNAVPGKAVKALMPFAHKLNTPFVQAAQHCHLLGKSFSHKCEVVPYPLRFCQTTQKIDAETIFDAINQTLKKQKSSSVTFSSIKKTIVIVGGSQGSTFLNKAIQQALAQNSTFAQSVQIIHQTGMNELEFYKQWYQQNHIVAYVFDFDAQLNWYYQIADLIICRAGAGTLFEIAHFGKQSIVIPLVASTTTHQKDNAAAIAEQYPNLFTVLEQQELEQNGNLFSQTLQSHLLS